MTDATAANVRKPSALARLFGAGTEDVDCTVEVSHTFESLHAHVRFADGRSVRPGDEVIVHGTAIEVPYGEVQQFDRKATILRATWPERLWTRMTGDFEFMELCEFSFSEEVKL